MYAKGSAIPAGWRLLKIVRMLPGLHFREVRRLTGMGNGGLRYHLDKLERSGSIVLERDGAKVRIFPNDYTSKERLIVARLREARSRAICEFFLRAGMATHREVRTAIKLPASTISYYLRKLESAGVLRVDREGRERLYRLAEPEILSKALSTISPSAFDRIVDSFLDTW